MRKKSNTLNEPELTTVGRNTRSSLCRPVDFSYMDLDRITNNKKKPVTGSRREIMQIDFQSDFTLEGVHDSTPIVQSDESATVQRSTVSTSDLLPCSYIIIVSFI